MMDNLSCFLPQLMLQLLNPLLSIHTLFIHTLVKDRLHTHCELNSRIIVSCPLRFSEKPRLE